MTVRSEGNGPDDVAGIVLAGGGSTRFVDGDKALASIDGEPMIRRVVRNLHRATDAPAVVVVRRSEQRARYRPILPPAVRYVQDLEGFSGPLAGVLGAATSVEARWLFVCACDMPLLSPPAVSWLLGHAGETNAVGVRHRDGTVESLHAGYRRASVLAVRDRLPQSGGVHSLFTVLDPIRIVDPNEAPDDVPLSESLVNVNTQEDLETLRDRFTESA